MSHRLTSFVFCLLTTTSTIWAQTAAPEAPPSALPAEINKKFLDPGIDAEKWAKTFERETREVFSCRKEVVEALHLSAGDDIADVGAGTGLFLPLFSEAVTDTGKIFAVEISPGLVKYMKERVEREGLDNVKVILSKEDSAEIPKASVDTVFVCDTYHHFEYHEEMLRSIHDALRDGGQLVVIDFERIPGKTKEWLVKHMRAGKEVFKKEIEEAGFKFEEEIKISGFSENYFLRFRKP